MNSEQADILDLLSGHTDDTTIERLAFECLLTNMTDDRVVSLMNILGWQGDFNCFAIGGVPSASLASTSLAIRKAVRDLGGEHVVIGTSGTFLLALACQMGAVTPEVTCTAVMPAFSEDEPLYLSPVRSGVAGASHALRNVYQVLRGENPDDPTYLTVSTFLKYGSSLENTAKELNVHPNTVRYRLKRAAETTGWDATDPRDAYVLTTALAIGRMRDR